MQEIQLNTKTLEIMSSLDRTIKESEHKMNLILQTVIAQSGLEGQFTLSQDRTKLIEIEKRPDDKVV
jgi:hypothetical protein